MNEIKGIQQYKQKVAQDHQTWVVRAYFSLYAFFWFYTEALWIKDPEARRPYTFIFRDWIFPHMKAFLVILAVWYVGIFIWLHWNPYPPAILIGLSSWLGAHLVWGGTWRQGEQEWPPYLGKAIIKEI